jgi:AcrR family transcriptional regulator
MRPAQDDAEMHAALEHAAGSAGRAGTAGTAAGAAARAEIAAAACPSQRPRRAPLTRDRIVAHALEIIDEDGLEALNMRRLAAAAGVKPMSLYHHFASKTEILDEVGESIAAAALGASPPHPDWKGRVRRLFMGLHALAEAHPRALPLISAAVLRTPSGRHWMEQLMSTLLDAGFTPDRAATVYHVLGAYTLGLGYARMLGDEVQTSDIVAQLAGHWAEYPGMMTVGLRLAVWDRPGEFETGLDVLLAHFAAQPGLTP